MLLKLTKIGERESHFKEISYPGFYTIEVFLRLRGQIKHMHKVTIHPHETRKTTANNTQNTQGNQQTIVRITRGTSSTNDA
jgi:hypothetical protein